MAKIPQVQEPRQVCDECGKTPNRCGCQSPRFVEAPPPMPEYKSGRYKIGTALTYAGVLNQIENELAAVRQWAGMENWTTAAEHSARAEALIELLEVHNCGSTGGFDAGQQQEEKRRGRNSTLEDRWYYLVRRKPDV